MKVLVCGGRGFADRGRVFAKLDLLLAEASSEMVVIHGMAPGADALADQWAVSRMVPVEQYEANWKRLGRAAGPLRNQRMIDEGRPDLCVCFPGGRGTADMVARCREAGIEVVEG